MPASAKEHGGPCDPPEKARNIRKADPKSTPESPCFPRPSSLVAAVDGAPYKRGRGRGAGVVDRDGLENRCACKRTVGSNPTLSASFAEDNYFSARAAGLK